MMTEDPGTTHIAARRDTAGKTGSDVRSQPRRPPIEPTSKNGVAATKGEPTEPRPIIAPRAGRSNQPLVRGGGSYPSRRARTEFAGVSKGRRRRPGLSV